MQTSIKQIISDFNYKEYSKLIESNIQKNNLREQIDKLKPGKNFFLNDNTWNVESYYGYAVVSMVNNCTQNNKLIDYLRGLKSLLDNKINQSPSFYMLPEDSYHQTIANTLSDHRFHRNISLNNLEDQYPNIIHDAFQKIERPKSDKPLELKVKGLNVFGSCIALLCDMDYGDYDLIYQFRKQFYSNEDLNTFDIKLTRPFIGHITLAYLGRDLESEEKEALLDICETENLKLKVQDLIFHINQCELRQYNDLTKFNTSEKYPVFSFIKK